MQQIQLQYRPVGMEFLKANSLPALGTLVTEALDRNMLLHGDWKALPDGNYVQAVCPADWRPMPPPPQSPKEESPIIQRPGQAILG